MAVHPAGTHHINIIDTVGDVCSVDGHLLGHQLKQPALLGQCHHRHQAGI
jgi:hypothetical protein